MAVSSALAADLAHYNRQPAGSDDRSYKFLIHSMERHINLHQQEKNRANDIKAIRSGAMVSGLAGAPAIAGEAGYQGFLSKTA